jgi:aminoglycoside 6'-N-acetyltransferase
MPRATLTAVHVRTPRLEIRPARPDDADAVAALLAEEEVARWFGVYDDARVRREMLDDHVIVVDGAVRGWLAIDEEDDPDYRCAALDISLTTALHGRGYGREALAAAIAELIAAGHHRFTIDPAADNARAIRCDRAVGFRPVGVMRAYERGRDGTWRDNLLMDLLAAEFRPPAR